VHRWSVASLGAVTLFTVAGCPSDVGFRNGAEPPPRPPIELPPFQEDAFVQQSSVESDVLFVVDNSLSMGDDQAALADNFPVFLEWFLDNPVEYHIGVVSTDTLLRSQAGVLRQADGLRWIMPGLPNPRQIFADMVQIGTDGANIESGRDAVYTALELRHDTNAGFVRQTADLHVIVVSDEDDRSGDDPISLRDFVAWLDGMKTNARRTTFSSIVGPEASSDKERCGSVKPGLQYLEVTRAVGGVEWSICTDDWAPMLDELGFVAAGFRSEFLLSRVPVPDTFELSVQVQDEVTHPQRDVIWVYEAGRNLVRFLTQLPPPGAIVRVRYEVAG